MWSPNLAKHHVDLVSNSNESSPLSSFDLASSSFGTHVNDSGIISGERGFLLNTEVLHLLSLPEDAEVCKGTFHLRFSGIRPLRGGGYPPFPLRKKTFFFPR